MIKLPQEVTTFMDSFKNAKYEIYLVGGAVRHLLLGEPVKNWDFTSNARPEKDRRSEF
jgi:poly(A) polymerase/tRNA nucleotidyltransferase (CCA-adding enzyme)